MLSNNPDYRALLRGVLKTPNDDTPRLVLADWLEEHSCPERAEFVRVQCDLARLRCRYSHYDTCFDRRDDLSGVERTGCKRCKAAIGLTVRESELWRQLLDAAPDQNYREEQAWGLPVGWLATYDRGRFALWPMFHHGGWPGALVRRGFVAEATCQAEDWVRHGDAVLAAHPVTRVQLTTWPQWGERSNVEPDGVVVDYQLLGDHRWFSVSKLSPNWDNGTAVGMALCRTRWPGVEFEQPWDEVRDAYREMTAEFEAEARRATFDGIRWTARIEETAHLITTRLFGAADERPWFGPGVTVGPLTAVDEQGELWAVERAVVRNVTAVQQLEPFDLRQATHTPAAAVPTRIFYEIEAIASGQVRRVTGRPQPPSMMDRVNPDAFRPPIPPLITIRDEVPDRVPAGEHVALVDGPHVSLADPVEWPATSPPPPDRPDA